MFGRPSLGGRNRGPPQVSYSFPILKTAELVFAAGTMQPPLPVTEEVLNKPTPASVRAIYEACLEQLCNTRRDELNQPKFAGLEELKYPELHEKSVPQLNLLREMKKLLDICGCRGMSLADLIHPNAKTLKWHLSGMINYYKYLDEKMAAYSQTTVETEETIERVAAVRAENEELRRQIAELRAEQEQELPQVRELEEACDGLLKEIKTSNNTQLQLQKDNMQLKQVTTGLKDSVAKCKLDLSGLKDEILSLESQIVHSPERLTTEIKSLERSLGEEKRETVGIEEQQHVLMAREAKQGKALKRLAKACRLIGEAEEEIGKYKNQLKRIKEGEDDVIVNDAKVVELKAKLALVERQFKRAEAKADESTRQQDHDAMSRADALRQAEAELEEVEVHHEEAVQQRAAAEERLKVFQEEAALARSVDEEKLKSRRREFMSFVNRAQACDADLLTAIGDATNRQQAAKEADKVTPVKVRGASASVAGGVGVGAENEAVPVAAAAGAGAGGSPRVAWGATFGAEQAQ